MKALPAFALFLALLPLTAQTASASTSHDLWEQAGYRFTPEVEAAYLAQAKESALAKLKADGKELPADFLAWVDADPARKATVYGAHQDASGILVILRSLELDLGQEAVRGKWEQLALAMAVTNGVDGGEELARASLTPRQPLVLVIPGDPRKPVDTHAKDRPLDVNDHIINFLNDHTIEEEVIVGWKEPIPELVYDAHGEAIPQPKAKPPEGAAKEKRKRSLYAADVIASEDLEKQFNAYMADHGHPEVKVHCGGPHGERMSWDSHSCLASKVGVNEAFKLFRDAYKAKGLIPNERDAKPSLAETCAFLIRNFNHTFTEEEKAAKHIVWPVFPVEKAPWPMLTFLGQIREPLRECEEAWERYRDQGDLPRSGDYLGHLGLMGNMKQGRRLIPFPFDYGSVQMDLKDGGVCGTMSGIATRSKTALGIPASVARQPSHSAMVSAGYTPQTGAWDYHGGHYVTAGDGGTTVSAGWPFGETEGLRHMVYYQCVGYSVNSNLQSFLDAQAGHAFYRTLSSAEQQAHGGVILSDLVAKAPYALFLDEDAAATLTNPADLATFLKTQLAAYPKGQPGDAASAPPASGRRKKSEVANGDSWMLPVITVKDIVFARLAALPPPKDPAQAKVILDFATANQCDDPKFLAAYKTAIVGVSASLADTATAFKAYVSGPRTYESSKDMAVTLATAAAGITDDKARIAWAKERLAEIQGHEMFMARFKDGGLYKVISIWTDPSAATLAELAKQKSRPRGEQLRSFFDGVSARFEAYVDSERTSDSSHAMAGELATIAVRAARIDEQGTKRFGEELAKILEGHETFPVKLKQQRDACADVIAKMAEEGK